MDELGGWISRLETGRLALYLCAQFRDLEGRISSILVSPLLRNKEEASTVRHLCTVVFIGKSEFELGREIGEANPTVARWGFSGPSVIHQRQTRINPLVLLCLQMRMCWRGCNCRPAAEYV